MRSFAWCAAALAAVALGLVSAVLPAAAAGGPSFVHGVLPPPPAGSTTTSNQAAEPQIRSDAAGNFYISSENGLGSGTDAWSSTNGGRTYTSLPQPNEVSSTSGGTTGLAPGGGDTDLATAPAKNATGRYNVYVASLTLGSVTVSLSQDGGATWANDVTAAKVPGDDREWIAAAGASGFYLSYHAISAADEIVVNQGQVVAGQPTTVQSYDAINPAQTDIYLGTVDDNEIGNIAVDPRTGDVYQIFVGCPPSATEIVSCADFDTAYMAVGVPSTTGGVTTLSFTDYVISQNSNAAAGFGNNFPAVAVDTAGNVYATWSDDQNVYLAFSTDDGQVWSTPRRVNQGSSATTAIFPWLTAGRPGKVDLTYYGTPAAANFQTCGQTGQFNCMNEPWSVFFAQNLNVLGGGSWTQSAVTPVVHDGGVCQGGVSCTSNGNDNRDLFDDFGIAASPSTGMASITYSDDQFADNTGSANAAECTSAQNNTSACDHTDYATQSSGHGIF
ncbi:MAG TPA: hypothetical protein VN695_19975 [Streptosporangiaceae bacterium]|nr:hypothetical protein [Streptosporangiaceae bacterium]